MEINNNDEIITVKDIYIAIDNDSNTSEQLENGKITTTIHLSHGSLYYSIEKFIENVIMTKELAYEFRWEKGKQRIYKFSLANDYKMLKHFIGIFDEEKHYSENVQLFFQCCKKNNIGYYSFMSHPGVFLAEFGKIGAAVFNDLIEDIRSAAKSSSFKKKVSSRKHNCIRNYRSAEKYVKTLFMKYSRMLVMRIDLGFRNDHPEQKNEMSLEKAQKYFFKFLNNIRNTDIYRNQIGYIWKLESGREKGYHFHLMFFYDGSLSQKDHYIADQIGKYWISLTEGVGIFYNCNASKHKYRNCGIGMVGHSDDAMCKNLYLALKYLFKKDQFLSEKFKLRTRVYGRGELPKLRVGGAGRPRKK